MSEMGGLLRNILPCLPCSSAQTPQHRQRQQQQRWCRQDGNTLSLEKIPCYKRTKQVSRTWHVWVCWMKINTIRKKMINRARTLASFSPSYTKSPLACLFFKPNKHEVKIVFKGLRASFLFIIIYLGGNCLRRVPSKHLWLSWSKRLAFCRTWGDVKKV